MGADQARPQGSHVLSEARTLGVRLPHAPPVQALLREWDEAGRSTGSLSEHAVFLRKRGQPGSKEVHVQRCVAIQGPRRIASRYAAKDRGKAAHSRCGRASPWASRKNTGDLSEGAEDPSAPTACAESETMDLIADKGIPYEQLPDFEDAARRTPSAHRRALGRHARSERSPAPSVSRREPRMPRSGFDLAGLFCRSALSAVSRASE